MEKKITQEEFDDFVNKVDRSQLPEGIKFELKCLMWGANASSVWGR